VIARSWWRRGWRFSSVRSPKPGQPKAFSLPAESKKDRSAVFRIHTGPKPQTGKAYVFFGMESQEKVDGEVFDVRVNGELCQFVPNMTPGAIHPIVKQVFGYEINLTDMNDGYNVVEIFPKDANVYSLVRAEIKIIP